MKAMQKEPTFTLRLSELDRVLMGSHPFFRIIPLKVTMEFREMTADQLRNLREYADAEDGRIERWILVPSAMPLSVLAYTIDRAFGLLPSPQSSSFFLPDDVRRLYAPDMASLFDLGGLLFFIPVDDEYLNIVYEEALHYDNCIPAFPYEFPSMPYQEAQKEIARIFGRFLDSGLDYLGKHFRLSELPAEGKVLHELMMAARFPVTAELNPALPVSYVVAAEGQKLPSVESVKKVLTRGYLNTFGRGAKPFTHSLIYEHLSPVPEDRGKGFWFTITRPHDVREILNDGYLRFNEYIRSITYVQRELLPDCLAKKGYDLFGENEEDYYSFIMNLHGPDRVSYRMLADAAGWREPNSDAKKILR